MSSLVTPKTHLERFIQYTDDPTPINALDFISPIAIKALGTRAASSSLEPTPIVEEIPIGDYIIERPWISSIQTCAETLSQEVIQSLSDIFHKALNCPTEEKGVLASALITIAEDNGIDFFAILQSAIENSKAKFEDLHQLEKEMCRLQIQKDLCTSVGEWLRDAERKRLSIIFDYRMSPLYSRVFSGLNSEKEEELYNVEMRFYQPLSDIDREVFSNTFCLNEYEQYNEFCWDEEIASLVASNENLRQQKAVVHAEKAKAIDEIDEKYRILSAAADAARASELEAQQKRLAQEVQTRTEQNTKLTMMLQQLNANSEERERMRQELSGKQTKKKGHCLIF